MFVIFSLILCFARSFANTDSCAITAYLDYDPIIYNYTALTNAIKSELFQKFETKVNIFLEINGTCNETALYIRGLIEIYNADLTIKYQNSIIYFFLNIFLIGAMKPIPMFSIFILQ